MSQPIAYAEHDGRSWRCDGCGSHGRACGGTHADGVRRAAETIAIHVSDCTPRSDRDRIIDALRHLAPGHPVTRVWGRFEHATAEQAQEGNAWAADVEDIADIVLRTLGRQ
ncbi:hypothetical protein [Streptomyces ossamyceticus]|uniref:hypothetical protein n=1 Tax=Streptomyces ossamyceticus TaxID=249581 RepID=UPI00343EFF45